MGAMGKRSSSRDDTPKPPTVTPTVGIGLLRCQIQRGQELLALEGLPYSRYEQWLTLAEACVVKSFGDGSRDHYTFLSAGRSTQMVFDQDNYDPNGASEQLERRQLLTNKIETLGTLIEILNINADADREKAQESGKAEAEPSIDVFLSHSKKDECLAGALVELLRDCLDIPRNRIRYTSGVGYRYDPGDDHDEEIRKEVYGCKVFVGLLTPNSIQSSYVLFELGARWGADKRIAPLMACGVMPGDLPGPVKGKNAFHASKAEDVIEFLEKIAKCIGKLPPTMSGVMSKVAKVVELAAASELKLPAKQPTPDASDIPLLIRGWIRGHHEHLSKTLVVRFQEIADELGVIVDCVAENFEHALTNSGFVQTNKSARVAELSRTPMSVELIPMRKSSRIDGLL